ncbi:MAG: MGH1-like glycoside hydrolase domain-containing protein [Candidatus Saccharimonadales bacterium]
MDTETDIEQPELVENSQSGVVNQNGQPAKAKAAAEPQDLLARAKAVLADNNQDGFTLPARDIYPHQWLWDSCFIAIGLSHYDLKRAQAEITSLLAGQWANGMLPHMILRTSDRNASDARMWRSWLNPQAPDDILTSGITQPPMLAEAITRIGENLNPGERKDWYKTIFPALLAYHQWLYAERDPSAIGLILQIHPWEIGLDNTPPSMDELHTNLMPSWLKIGHKIRLENLINLLRRDLKSIPKDQRLSAFDDVGLYVLQRRLSRQHYDIDKVLNSRGFKLEDLTFNCIFIRANQLLKTIAAEIGESLPANMTRQIDLSQTALEALWDETSQEYFSRNFTSRELIKISTVAALMPLYAGCAPKDHLEKIVHMLENDHNYGPAWPVPSVPISSEWFKRQDYWQGPTWLNTNWLIIDGLKRAGYADHAAALTENTLELVEKSGFYEYFDPISGEPAGINNFSWTAALTIDLLENKP